MTVSLQYCQARDRFVALLENPGSLERDWEALFTQFPFILTDCLSLGIEPAQLIPCKPGRTEADFYFYPRAKDPLSRYGVIEIKRPKTVILNTPRKDVIVLSSDAATAVAQAQKYAIELGAEICKAPARSLVLGNPHHMFVIAGMSAEIARKVTTELHSKQFRRLVPSNCRLIPYDELSGSLASRTPPMFHVLLPWPTDMPSTPREAGGFQESGFGEREMHGTACTECGKKIEVPFKPSGDRPVFCRECFGVKRRLYASKSGPKKDQAVM